jgi:hypothetical protein
MPVPPRITFVTRDACVPGHPQEVDAAYATGGLTFP